MIANIWHLLNLESSPFFQTQLGAAEDAIHPLDLFIGRESEAKQLTEIIVGSGTSRQTVPGAPGVGKSTLVELVKGKLQEVGYIANANAVSAGSADTVDRILAKVLSSVYQAVLSSGGARIADFEAMKEARQLVRAFQTRSIGATLGPIGGTVSTTHVTPENVLSWRASALLMALGQLAQDELGVEGIIIDLDNLENLTEVDSERTSQILRDLRDDVFMLPHYHYLVVGTQEAIQGGLLRHKQMRSVFHSLSPLRPLIPDEFLELLKKRYDYLRLDPEQPVHPPVTEETVVEVYGAFSGDLRGALRALEEVSYKLIGVAGDRPTDPVQVADATAVLRQLYLEEIGDSVSDEDAELVYRLLKQFQSSTFTQSDIAKTMEMTQSVVSDSLLRLEQAGLVVKAGKQDTPRGRRPQLYLVTGPPRLAFS